MSGDVKFDGHLVVQQRVLPTYRVPFFERLSGACGRLTVVAGMPRPSEAIASAPSLNGAEWIRLENRHLGRGKLYLCRQPGLIPALTALSPDAVVLEANPRYPANWRARTWARSAGTPVLGWGLGAETSNAATAWIWRRFLAGLDGMIAYSSRGAAAFRRLGVKADRVTLALNAVGPAPVRAPSGGERPAGPLQVLYVGRLQRRKRVDELIMACAELTVPPALVIVGDGPERKSLESLADSRLPGTRFEGHLEGRALDEAFSQADVFVLPGTGGLAVQQAMAHGLPVVVGEGDGTADDLVRPQNGWRIAPGDVPGLARVLRQADADRTGLARMGAESYRIAASEVNIESMADAFVKAITSVASVG